MRGPRASLSGAPARAAPSTPRARLARAAWIALALAGCATPDPGPNRDRVVLHATEVTPLLGEVELRCAADTGKRVRLGGRVHVVELWATWCQPCVRALPLWSARAHADGIAVLAVSIDDEAEAPLAFARKHGVDLPILWDPFAAEIARAVPLGGVVPTTLVVDCQGRVRHVHEGFRGSDSIEAIVTQVRALEQEPSCTAEAAPSSATCPR